MKEERIPRPSSVARPAPPRRRRRRRRARRWCGRVQSMMRAHLLGADDQHLLRLPGGDVRLGHRQPVEEAGAGGGEVVGAGVASRRAAPGCRRRWRAAAGPAWRWRRGSCRPRRGRGPPARARCARRARRPCPPRPSPSSAIRRSRMPVRVRIHSSEVSTIFSRSAFVIDPRREEAARSPAIRRERLLLAHARHEAFGCGGARAGSGCAPPCSRSTACTATRIAFRIARGGEPPWQMITTPFTPSSGAPPYSV